MIDTLEYVKKLEGTGISRTSAEAQVEIMADIVFKNLATRDDLRALEFKIEEKLLNFHHKTHNDFAEIRHEITKLEHRMTLKVGGIMYAGLAALGILIKLF